MSRARGIVLVMAMLVLGGCAYARTSTRAVEIDASQDVVFRAAAATLMDDRQVFDLSDRDAGLLVGVARGADYLTRRTTIWVTPIEDAADERSFVVLQVFGITTSSAGHGERLDWLLARLRQRCVMGGDIEPFDEDEPDADQSGVGGDEGST